MESTEHSSDDQREEGIANDAYGLEKGAIAWLAGSTTVSPVTLHISSQEFYLHCDHRLSYPDQSENS